MMGWMMSAFRARLDRVEQLQQRLEAMTTAALALARHQDRDQC